jgi:hypothetical protein
MPAADPDAHVQKAFSNSFRSAVCGAFSYRRFAFPPPLIPFIFPFAASVMSAFAYMQLSQKSKED